MFISCVDLNAQLISCSYQPANYEWNCNESLLKSAFSVDDFKTIRVNIHFVLRSDGTGNFTETENINGSTSSQDGYWFAQKAIELCNSQLTNETMTQQLSYESIPVNNINYSYVLNAVFFLRNNTAFNYPSTNSSWTENQNDVINIFLYPNNDGNGASSGLRCWCGGTSSAYTNYLLYGNWGIERYTSRLVNHEVGHCLSLDHCKRTPGGDCCTTDASTCLDDCEDTPTYNELFVDGYTDPCIWNGTGYSNNIMDYSPLQKAFTPCQIAKVHSFIESSLFNYQYGNFGTSSVAVTSFGSNKSYIAESVIIPTGYSVSIPNNQKLYIDAKNLVINGQFEVPLGSTFEFVPYGL